MNCVSPMSIPRPNGLGSIDRITIPCGKCLACKQKKRNQWAFRLEEELKTSTSATFVTLTYSDEFLPNPPVLDKTHVQLFLKRLRHYVPFLRYFITGEYGSETKRPHYHAILFNLPMYCENLLIEKWHLGHIFLGTVTPASISYVAKYCQNESGESFAMMSLKPAIGSAYIEKMAIFHNENNAFYGITTGNNKVSMPRYYRDKIFKKTDLVKNKIETRSINEKVQDEKHEKSRKLNENPFQNELENGIQKINSIINNSKKSAKL